jgi:hypothetical protein
VFRTEDLKLCNDANLKTNRVKNFHRAANYSSF